VLKLLREWRWIELVLFSGGQRAQERDILIGELREIGLKLLSLQLSRYFGPKLRGRVVPTGEQFAADEGEEVRMAECLLVEPGREKLNIVVPFENRFRIFRSFVKCERSQNEFVVEADGRFREASNCGEIIGLR